MYKITHCSQRMHLSLFAFMLVTSLAFASSYLLADSLTAGADTTYHADAAEDLRDHAGSIIRFFGWTITGLISLGIALITYTYKMSLANIQEKNDMKFSVVSETVRLQMDGLGGRISSLEARIHSAEGSIITLERLVDKKFMTKHEHSLICKRPVDEED